MSQQPNILVLMSDQQRLDTVSAYGLNEIVRTPHIDGIAERGVRFDYAFTPTAICSPARASFYTGLYPHHHGVTGNGLCIREGIRGFNQYLEEAGYVSGYAGKWHIDEGRGPSEMGFRGQDFMGYAFPGSGLLPGLQFGAKPRGGNPYADYLEEKGFGLPTVSHRYVGTNPGCSAQEMFALHEGPVESCVEYFVAHESIRVMESLVNQEKPFFLWANFWGPHTPCLVPEPYFSMYNPDDIPEHPSYCETFERKPRVQSIIERMWGLGDYGWRGFQEIAARYYGHCTLIDDMVGHVLSALKRLGQLENTIVIYTADHGDCLGAHKLIEKGAFATSSFICMRHCRRC
ncbi:sulfatase-like hydrolase/transferase [Chloroflexi bacterium TSY]|nr:sulfatase-like hydrolase/transferase [Chloroflexi bacterium TSY]